MLTALLAVAFAASSAADRARLSRGDQEQLLRRASPAELFAGGRAAVDALGLYRGRRAQRGRLAGKLQEEQKRRLTVREKPFAVLVLCEVGGKVGRRILFDSQVDPRHLRIHEPGVLSILGWVSIAADDARIFKSTNHPITDVGFAAMLRQEEQDLAQGQPYGGYLRTDDGWNERGHYCLRFDAPPGAGKLYAYRSRLCVDPVSWLPVEMTVWDEAGLLETYLYTDLEPNVAGGAAALTP